MKNTFSIQIHTKTDTGIDRLNNEDSVGQKTISTNDNKKYRLLVIADGMGGLQKGKLASNIAVDTFINTVSDSLTSISIKKKYKNKLSNILVTAVETANTEVFKISQNQQKGTGTTLVGAMITDDKIYIVNVGDSRAYLVKQNGNIEKITKDHTAVQEMLEHNVITKEQAINHPRRNLLTKALGLKETVKVDFFEKPLEEELLLLCSDGFYSLIDEQEFLKFRVENIYEATDDLIKLANRRGGFDNISVAIALISK